MRPGHILIIMALLAVMACPQSAKKTRSGAAGEAGSVLLRYKFPPNRVDHYTIIEESMGRFSLSHMPVFQKIRARNTMTVADRVVQQPLGGYATLSRRIESMRLQVWKNDNLYFDSRELEKFAEMPEAQDYRNIKNKVITYEMNELGRMRNLSGLDDVNIKGESTQQMRLIETGYPVLTKQPVRIGDRWKDSRKTPFLLPKGDSGVIEIEETVTLADIKVGEGFSVAILESRRELKIKVYRAESKSPWRGFSGEGRTVGKFALNIEEGKILQTNTRSTLNVATKINTSESKIDTSTELDFHTQSHIVE